MSDTARDFQDIGPFGQSIALAFRFLLIGACVLAAGWFFSNLHQIPPDSQAVVVRFGSVARVEGPGLLLAWPKPIESVVVLPGSARQIPLTITRFVESQTPDADPTQGFDLNPDPRLNGGFLLTGDSAVVHLQAQLFYQITDPVAYMIAAQHVGPALQRLFIASAISLAASRDLDSILVARPEVAARRDEAARRERLRSDLLNAVNRRIAELTRAGASLGVTVSRVDLVPSIPLVAKSAFDNVLVVTQRVQTGIATARTGAEIAMQEANRVRDRISTDATAAADERIADARVRTDSITALGQNAQGMSHSMQLSRLYYDRIGALLKRAGRVEVVDSNGVAHILLPGAPR